MMRVTILLSLILWLLPEVAKSQDLVDQVKESFTDINTVTVKGIFCSVEVEPGSNSTVTLEGEIRATRKYEDLRISYNKTGNTLEVVVEQPSNIVGQVKGFLRLTVPASVLLDVKTVSGSIEVNGVGRDNLVLEAVSGSIEASNIPCNASIKTVSGSIKASVIQGDLKASAVSGSLIVNDVKGWAELKSVSGSINAESIMKEVNASSVSGSVTLAEVFSNVKCKTVSNSLSLSDVKGNVEASSSSGSISMNRIIGAVEATCVSGSIKGSSVMLTGNGIFSNTSGSIAMDFDNESEALSFDLRSLSGSLEAFGSNGSKHLVVETGPIKITGKTVSGSQKYW
jgi:DUF4097 and DUF4098 domain-containing protein YvlB